MEGEVLHGNHGKHYATRRKMEAWVSDNFTGSILYFLVNIVGT